MEAVSRNKASNEWKGCTHALSAHHRRDRRLISLTVSWIFRDCREWQHRQWMCWIHIHLHPPPPNKPTLKRGGLLNRGVTRIHTTEEPLYWPRTLLFHYGPYWHDKDCWLHAFPQGSFDYLISGEFVETVTGSTGSELLLAAWCTACGSFTDLGCPEWSVKLRSWCEPHTGLRSTPQDQLSVGIVPYRKPPSGI